MLNILRDLSCFAITKKIKFKKRRLDIMAVSVLLETTYWVDKVNKVNFQLVP
jgi:hypothetical protein